MKALLEWITDKWWFFWHEQHNWIDEDDLALTVFVHRLTGKTSAMMFSRHNTPVPGMFKFHAYEVDQLTQEGHAQLLRMFEGGKVTLGQLIVWLWHQGVSEPQETFIGKDHLG